MSESRLSDEAITAMAHPSRRRIVEVLTAMSDGVTAFDLADRVDLHHNAVRTHLSILSRAGLVSSARERLTGRSGRPRIIYRLADPAAMAEVESGQALVGMLLKLVQSAGLTEPEIEAAGVEDGRALAGQGMGLVSGFRRMGFAPDDITDAAAARRGETEVLLRHCPYADSITPETAPTICGLHRGVVRGILADEHGELVAFDAVDPRTGPCRVVTRGAPRADTE